MAVQVLRFITNWKKETKGNYPVYLTRPSLDSVSYDHLYAGCLSKYN